jgi:hypothetical protein
MPTLGLIFMINGENERSHGELPKKQELGIRGNPLPDVYSHFLWGERKFLPGNPLSSA